MDDGRRSIFSSDPETPERVVDRYYGGEWHRIPLGGKTGDDDGGDE